MVRRGGGTALEEVGARAARAPDDVVIEVRAAGVCRTNLHAARGAIACAEGRVLGHELSGVVAEVGPGVTRVRVGDRVTVMPFLGCGRCAACDEERPWRCGGARMLGVDVDGAFADALSVPERAVHRLPDEVSFLVGAYAEPVAAALAVGSAGIRPSDRVLLLGEGRIATLTRRALGVLGIARVDEVAPDDALGVSARAYDVAIEARATERTLEALLDAVRPGGTIVLKSRPHAPVPIDLARAVRREVTLRAVAYAPFGDAIALLSSRALALETLVGPVLPLEAHGDAFALAERSERDKVFLAPDPERL